MNVDTRCHSSELRCTRKAFHPGSCFYERETEREWELSVATQGLRCDFMIVKPGDKLKRLNGFVGTLEDRDE